MDDMMLQINGTKPNEAVMKVFNILFPYDKPLPHGRGDELSLQDFYGGLRQQVNEERECDPDWLKANLNKEVDAETANALRNNKVEEVQDLLDIKRQLMAMEQVNAMHQLTIQEKDDLIRDLQEKVKNGEGMQRGGLVQNEE